MMKLFGTNKNRTPGGADNGGLGHETELKLGVIPEDEVDNMKPTKEWNDIKSTNKNKTPEQKLMESMLLVATKIRQYEELLYNETILRNEDVDTLSLEAMVRRYANQVRVADAICSKGCAVIEDAAYRRYADSFRSYIREPNLSLCFKKSPPTDENIAKKEKDTEELLSGSGMHKTDVDDDDKIGNRVIPTPGQADHSEKYGTVDVPPPQTMEPLPTTNTTDSHIINCTEKLSLCEKCSPRVAISGVEEEESCTADSDAATPRFKAIESVTPKSSHTKPKRKAKQRPGIYNVGSDQDIVDAPAEYQNRYAVFKTRSIQRLPVANLFDTPTPESSHVLMSPRSTVRDITNSHNNTNFLAAGDAAEDAVPWMNKSKSANESWYEFKERCSRSNNNSFVNSPPSRNFPVHGTFHVKDSPNYESTVRVAQKKFVRFSVSPIKSSSRRAHYIPSDSSSDEDDLQFEVDQFPCVYKSYQKSPHSRNHH